MSRLFIAALALFVLATNALAEVKLPTILGSNMVVQQNQLVPIWGTAASGEKVTVTFMGQTKTATAGQDGKWRVNLDPVKATDQPQTMTIAASNRIELDNVLVGEVWVCSGQSNMQWSVKQSDNPEQEIAAAKYPKIRLISVPRKSTPEPQSDFEGEWIECSPQSVENFSAVAYYFGRELHNELKVPVGLINTSYGGTPVEAWTSRAALESAGPSAKPLLERWDQQVADYDPKTAGEQYNKQVAQWKEQAAKAKEAGKAEPRRPQPPANPATSQHRPAGLYNAMIQPLLPVAIRGAIWYQGESNATRAYQYRTLFPAMIHNWRDVWGQKGDAAEFPFYFVQIAPFRYTRNDPQMAAELWEAQLLAMKNVPNTGMIVTTDIGNIENIHPTNKQEVGRRLALWALAKTYGQSSLPHSGPIYKSAKFASGMATLTFDHAAGLKSRDDKPLTHFQIAGKDKQFHPAEAKVTGDTIVVTSDHVKEPVAVRFAWDDSAEPNLVNAAGLPAAPFRTDEWPGVTVNNF